MIRRLSWSDVSVYRNQLFLIAMITIYVHHYFENAAIPGATDHWNLIFGSDGVEIFVFLSGMGLCFSLNKNYNWKLFYIKRFKRIIPTYLLIGGICWGVVDFVFLKQPGRLCPYNWCKF